MEPEISFAKETQIYSRIHRIGQQATFTQSYRLWCESKFARDNLKNREEPRWKVWEWEGKAVDRIRGRKLTFGKKEKKGREKTDEPGTDTGGDFTGTENEAESSLYG